MKNRENSTVEPVFSERIKKNEERVYLDQDLVDYLDRLQAKLNLRRRSQALRHCIEQQRTREATQQTERPKPAASSPRADGACRHRPEPAGTDQLSKQRSLLLQAAIAVLRPPREQVCEDEEALWQEALELAEPLAAGFVEGVGGLLSRKVAERSDRLPSLLRTVGVDAAQAAVASGQRALLGRMGQYFARKKGEKQ